MRNIFPCCTRQWDPFLHFACVHLLYHPFFLLFLYILSSLPSVGLSQSCYTEPNCVGSTVEASTARECCVETENGTSFGEAGNCAVTQCIGESRYRITICSLYLPVRKDLLMYFSLPTLHSHIQKPANRFLQIYKTTIVNGRLAQFMYTPLFVTITPGFVGSNVYIFPKSYGIAVVSRIPSLCHNVRCLWALAQLLLTLTSAVWEALTPHAHTHTALGYVGMH